MNKQIKNQIVFFSVIIIILVLLWLPSFVNPSYLGKDVQKYSVLSENLIKTGEYSILGEPHSLYPPGHSLLAMPFVFLFGKITGFKLATLFWTIVFLVTSFYLFYDKKDKLRSYIIIGLLLVSPLVIYNSMTGASDIVFATFFVLSLYFFKISQKDQGFYYLTGIITGVTCLIRYPGIIDRKSVV